MRKASRVRRTKEKKDRPLFSKVELLILGNGLALNGMVMEYKSGLIMPNMRGNGARIKLPGKGNFGMLMEIILTVNGKRIRLMAMEFTCIQMEPNMKDIGWMISKTAMASNHGN